MSDNPRYKQFENECPKCFCSNIKTVSRREKKDLPIGIIVNTFYQCNECKHQWSIKKLK